MFKWKGIKAQVYWCKNCNIPLISPKCELCNEIAGKIHASPPLDVRPAFEMDLKRIRRSIAEEYDDWKLAFTLIPSGKLVLLNKIVYPDQADEVIVDGWTIGHCFYDPLKRKWRFKPVIEGCARIIELRMGYWCRISYNKVKLWQRIPRSAIINGELPNENDKYIAIASKNWKSIGVGVLDGDHIRVIKAWRPQKTHFKDVSSTLIDVIRGNKRRLESLENRAKAFIKEVYNKFGKPVLVSFSGGKDSLATLLLALESIGEVPIMFNDTGIEMPETVSHVKEIVDRYGLELLEANAGDVFWKSVKVFGPPARDYRWCCKVCKLIPIATTMKKKFPNGSLNLVGQRRFESIARAKSPSIWRNKWIPNVIAASPIMEWSALHIWLYLTWKKAKTNPLYFMGFDRIGCWLCPACELAEFKLVEQIHPELWMKWKIELQSWAKLKGLPNEWIEYGLWRWQNIPGDQIKMLRKIGIEIKSEEIKMKRMPTKIIEIKGYEPCKGTYSINGILDSSIDINKVGDLAPVIGKRKISDTLKILLIKTEKGEITVHENGRISVTSKSQKDAEELFYKTLKIIIRASYCTLCGSCINVCPVNAVTLNNSPKVSESKCIRCGKCQEACPASSYIGRIIIEQIIKSK
ncbi:MAG: hypothetical protein DRJ21_01185 [Candidatus Methanomethylicota archaeon]|uniref:4Fe-4S ferredoxin-type domain-containing protein n=1 Tax=Thermoproteota archaeon TaxID=2056631 RepID=A0A497EW66_9CREN|nr:MAG: hypothetical protein DRJ21_01185 [Candidatus Verstraetearchaeota archaeon]